jgi:hypothetical protein
MITASEFLKWLEIFNVSFGGSVITIPVSIAQGGTGVTSVTTAPTASMWAGWDANKNLSANNFLSGYTTTVTAAGTTTFTVGSTYQHYFTGSITQTVILPVTSTLVLGQSFYIVNNSSGTVTVESSGANTIQAMAANTTLLVTCISTSGATAASWSAQYNAGNPAGTFLPLAGGTMSGAINMGNFNITNLATPSNQMDAATKAYVDLVAQGLNILPAAQAASTVTLTASYSNGSSGVGATLTNSGAQAAFVIDGYTASLNDIILIKNQSSTLQNGVYTVTNIGSGSTNWVLTRATFYNTAQNINPGDLILINNGSQGKTGWIQTAVVLTIGTDPISFSQFGAVFPITVPNGGSGNTSAIAYGVLTGGITSTSQFQSVTPGASGSIFQSAGSSSLPTWSMATYPSTSTINQLLYSSSSNIISGLSTGNNAVLVTSSGGVPSLSTTLPSGLTIPGYLDSSLLLTQIYMGNSSNIAEKVNLVGDMHLTYGGSGIGNTLVVAINGAQLGSTTANPGNVLIGNGVNWNTTAISGDATLVSSGALTVSKIGGVAISLAGSFTTSGAFAVTQTYTGATTVTFPTSGTLATTSQIPTGAALTKTDDTNVTLTLGGTPSTALLQAASLTLGWTGTLSGTRGGTGVNNGASTITLGGSLTTSGAFASTFTMTNTTSVTFPTSGTLATTAQLTGLTWNDVSGTTQAAVVNNGYIISNAAQTTVTIPATAAEGSLFAVQGKGAAGWILQMNTGQICHFGSSPTTSAGSLTSSNLWDCVEIICVTANTTFAVRSSVGNITVA